MTPLPATHIVLVDDHELYRVGLRATIAKMGEAFSVIKECVTRNEFDAFLQQNTIPDLAILDIRLPDGNGIEIARRLKTDYPQVKIIMLSSEVSEEIITELLDIDVEGYLSKMAQMSDVEKAIRTVLTDSKFYGQSISKMMYETYKANAVNTQKKSIFSVKKQEALTPREVEIIQHLCNGYTAKQVGEQLNLSYRTVETHRNNILHKLGFNSTTELIKYSVQHGMVEWE